jgi:hypothetical protein
MNGTDGDGGFIRQTFLPSPAPSSINSTTAAVHLPRTRSKPLPSGSAKESQFIRYLDEQIQKITRKHTRRGMGDSEGYRSFDELAKDVETLIELVWISATREF